MPRAGLFDQSASPRPRETFAMVVEGYDVAATKPAVIGSRLDDGRRVTVSLRPGVSGQRPTVEQFAEERVDQRDVSTAIGGTLLVQDAEQLGAGQYEARWLKALSHRPGEAEVVQTTAYVFPVSAPPSNRPNGAPSCAARLVHDGDASHLSQAMVNALRWLPPQHVRSMAELERELETRMSTFAVGVGIRLRMPDDSWDSIELIARKEQDPRDVIASKLGLFSPAMRSAVDSGAALCEVVSFSDVWMAPKSAAAVYSGRDVIQSRRLDQYTVVLPGHQHPQRLYRPTILSALLGTNNDTGEQYVMWRYAEPLLNRFPLVGLRNAIAYMQTANFAPDIPRPTEVLDALRQRSGAAPATAPETAPASTRRPVAPAR